MSFNNQHNIPVLTRANYEEYFLMYVDDELAPEARKAVDDFALLHPDLKEELDLLCSTKLPADDFSFGNKESLFADSMKVNAIDEALLLYIDNELPAAEMDTVEAKLKTDAAFALQHALLLKTKVDKDEKISYPYKNELYRRTERRVTAVWLRVAAAVILVAGTGAAFWLNGDTTTNSTPVVAVATPGNTAKQPTNATRQAEAPAVTSQTNTLAALPENKQATAKTGLPNATPTMARRKAEKVAPATFSKAHTAIETAIASNNLPVAKKTVANDLQTGASKKVQQQILSNPVVTSDIAAAYVSIDAAAKTTVPVQAVALDDNEKSGGSMKGFLRKATRFIERRTGIKAVNDDDELLIGAVALKL